MIELTFLKELILIKQAHQKSMTFLTKQSYVLIFDVNIDRIIVSNKVPSG